MSPAILGKGWVTPLGTDLASVYQAINEGKRGEVKELPGDLPNRVHTGMPVPPDLVQAVGRNPRLRRSSAITYFTATAGLAALADAGLKVSPELADRMAVVLAVSSGSVVYTRRFYDQILKSGAAAASPMLFPETVYNAPASHLSALLGTTGQTYTVVGDGAVGLVALHFGAELLALEDLDYVLVVAAEELDWVICEAYNQWRIKTTYSEGAGAVLLGKEGQFTVQTHPGAVFTKRADAVAALDGVCAQFASGSPDLVVTSTGGSVLDADEERVLVAKYPQVERRSPKASLGESLGASTLQQVIYASLAAEHERKREVLVTALGYNEQAAAALVRGPGL